jgi:peptidoglycan/xylan/chitin deacetylase (PgdA/CDA1 family)
MKNIFTKITTFLVTIIMLMTIVAFSAQAAYAAGTVTITFDDGFLSTYTNALPILSARNIKATIYPNISTLNTGHQPDGFPGMSWAQLAALQNTYGWEVGSHTATHPNLPTLTQAQIAQEFATANGELAAHGLNVTNLATPFGAYDNKTLIEALKVYNSQRGFADRSTTFNSFPYTKSVLQVQSLESNVSPTVVKGWIDQAKANNTWLILVAHDTQAAYNPNYIYTVTTADLSTIADYIVSSGISVKTIEQGLQKPGVNVLANYNFANGMTNWTADNAQTTLDSNNNGAYTDSTHSVKMTGGTSATHLFSGVVDAVYGAQYSLEAFYNTNALTAGELGFYIDEYDANGNWISGKWIGMVANKAVGYFEKLYTVTSSLVTKLSVQTYLTAGATGTAYIDNIDLHNLDASGTPAPTGTPNPTVSITGTPSVTPSVSPAPIPQNTFVENGSFENLMSGWATGWIRSSDTALKIDTTSKGDNGTNSVHLTTTNETVYLFSNQIDVDTNDTYTWKTYVKANTLSGEFGFYLDEYDSDGTWISGQWKGALFAPATQTVTFSYKPTSSDVSTVGIQYYMIGASSNIFIDSVSLTGTQAATATPTLTGTPSVTATPTVSPTGTPSITPSVTPIPSVSPSATPTPTVGPSVNVVQNSSFETIASGFAGNWSRNANGNSIYSLDTTSKGNNGANSVHISGFTSTGHLFSDPFTVEQAAYSWKTYINAISLVGEFGFYIDEYDAAGNWISGQWKGAIYGPFTQVASFGYTPTSTNVAKASLQYYLTGGSTADIYIDSVSVSK